MAVNERSTVHKVLLVDDDDAVLAMTSAMLGSRGFEVTAAVGVTEALRHIASENFDVLITDLHMPNADDGFTLITAMRHCQPEALTLLVSGYPDVQSAMAAILLEVDDIIVKPFEVNRLGELIREKYLARRPAVRAPKERIEAVLQRSISSIVAACLARAKESNELRGFSLGDAEWVGHLSGMVEDLVQRLSRVGGNLTEQFARNSSAAAAHGELRHLQGYTPAMLVQESRIFQRTIFDTLQSNLDNLDFSHALPDVMTIADEVESQLTEAMNSYMKVNRKSAA